MPPSSKTEQSPLDEGLSHSLLAVLQTIRSQPCHHAQQGVRAVRQLLNAVADRGDLAELLGDPRFAHAAWNDPLRRRLLKLWQGGSTQSNEWLEGLHIADSDKARLRLFIRHLSDALAPSNSPLNPLFTEQVVSTRGRNIRDGLLHLVGDLALKRPLPAQNSDGGFVVGRDVATAAGSVVLREPLFELIQYQPTTATVHAAPLVIIPPPLNRFYLLDMTPGTSLVQHALDQGLQVFLISWRNPNPSQCGWGFERYVQGAEAAVRAASKVSGNPATLLGVCAGGLIGLMLQGRLQAQNQSSLVSAATYLVTPIDARINADWTLMAGPGARQQLRNQVWRQGCMGPRQLAAGFAWLRPDQLIWPQILQRYALGQEAAPHPVKFWNQDSTRLPAQLVDDLMTLFERDPLGKPDGLSLGGVDIDLSKVTTPSWHLGAERDHIVPWVNSFPAARLGGDKTFLLCQGGHIQSLINPPGTPRAWYQSGAVKNASPEAWLQESARQEGSWWPAWSDWLKARSGPAIQAPLAAGDAQHQPLGPAPGRYVNQL
ncbi:MAG TPA: class II poly(R)-hydroxyalkanoic acid synthase [Pseudomonas xinjiangensis]|uniref:Class II poly(R)-hydroxyalkanoic acid synthase n=2 Tax=root TaxID=1 RepID=A0A7V1FSQ2_9GAMM|nr:class II poly(R)-hydroxyalkanoic acid synthase [Halopseudomonas xinjiangensis]HEC48342.1 class II poly(R)-hydroxyalkanoic acid synthase [Halopseudomonas xinjiangensis]